jgi:DNA processing protein
MTTPTDCNDRPATRKDRAGEVPRARARPSANPAHRDRARTPADVRADVHAAGDGERLRELLVRPVVAMAGARHSTYYGQETARRLARELAKAGVTIVAGLTEGIEARAHHAVLEAGKPTIAVVSGSPQIPYPPGQKHLHTKLLERGCVVGPGHKRADTLDSQADDRNPQERDHDPRASYRNPQDPLLERNRLIAELAQVVILVEATTGAAAMQTAERALELGREVGAVPGRIVDESAGGPNRLIREGAHPILETKDVLDLLA